MNCRYCDEEIPRDSRFCPVCGRNVTTAPTSRDATGSFLALPESAGARFFRLGLLLLVNLALIATGTLFFFAYLNKRESFSLAVTYDADTSKAFGQAEAEDMDAHSAAPSVADTEDAANQTPPIRRPTAKKSTPPDRDSTKDSVSKAPVGDHDTTMTTSDAATGTPADFDDETRIRLIAGKISLVVAGHKGQIQRCYERAAKSMGPERPLQGRVSVGFRVEPDGKTIDVLVAEDNTGSPTLGACLVGLVKTWTLPSSGSESLGFVWPFEFKAP